MTKNPYEIRFDLLNMAKDMLDRQYDQSSTMAWEAMNKAMKTDRDLYKDVEKYVPKMFTPEEIIAQAEKLQTFINKKEG
jgi:hypothetical protein